MNSSPGRFSQLRWLQTVTFVAGALGAVLLILLGFAGYGSSASVWMVAAGGFLLFLAVALMSLAPLLLKIEASIARQLNELRDFQDLAAKQSAHLEAIVENTNISDAAKSLAHREEELAALRSAIRSSIRAETWDSALNLIEDMERRFGYKDEADRIREELDDARNDRIQSRLTEAIEMIESHFESHQWERAEAEIQRLVHALPDDSRVHSLKDRLAALREQHKRELKQAWDDAVRRNDTDQAIDILKELDPYLSPAEAQAFQDSARNVFKEKLLQLGVQFRFAVTEKRWQDALSTGLEIVREFPNARMATEVREVLETLRERVRQAAEGRPTSPMAESRG